MRVRRDVHAIVCVLGLAFLGGCSTFGSDRLGGRDVDLEERLVLLVADLRMHLGDDTYRSFRHVDERGTNVFQATLRRISEMQHQRGRAVQDFSQVDWVLEFARARCLERLRRYEEAASAYARVSVSDTPMATAAEDALRVVRRFAAEKAAAPRASSEIERDHLDALVRAWTDLAWRHRETAYGWLALEEAELWDRVRLERIAHEQGPEAAIRRGNELIERHRESKLFPRHVIRLGDLHAELARLEHVHGSGMSGFDVARYERNLDRALAAYELASEARRDAFRREAESKLEALLAYHEGVRPNAP